MAQNLPITIMLEEKFPHVEKGYLLFFGKRINTSKSLRAQKIYATQNRSSKKKMKIKKCRVPSALLVRILMIENKSFMFVVWKKSLIFMGYLECVLRNHNISVH